MLAAEIEQLVSGRLFPGDGEGVSFVETHASWVILTKEWAFKIKKPVNFGFLDFSTIEKRLFYCTEELRLNQRLAPDIYLRVLPVGNQGIGDDTPPTKDYALQMRRIDNTREMDRLLETGDVLSSDMAALAGILAPFHLRNRLYDLPLYDPDAEVNDFADLFQLRDVLAGIDREAPGYIAKWAVFIPFFLKQRTGRISVRRQSGFWTEGHGDLHSRNIFLPENERPVIFDCIEFSDRFRKMDVLSELAFLCMDLAYFERNDLANDFMKTYCHHWPCLEGTEDDFLFTYYKAYRANIRLKVTLLQWQQQHRPELLDMASKYWNLLKAYMADIQKGR